MQLNSYQAQLHLSMQQYSGPSFGGGMGQLMNVLRSMMAVMSRSFGFTPGGQGNCMAPSRPNFGCPDGFQHAPRNCGTGAGLSNFCGGPAPQNFDNCNPNDVNINLNFGGGPQGCRPRQQQCGQQGALEQKGEGKPITYTTSGGYKVTVNKHDISVKDPHGNDVTHYGDPHEKLNGKHLKDWEGKQRTMILGDGTKITMTADGPHGVTQNTSIYDQNQNVQIANAKNEIQHHSVNGMDTLFREATQHDGETARFHTNGQGDALYYNIYNQAEDGTVTRNFDWLGMSEGPGKEVHDLYDDKRLQHT